VTETTNPVHLVIVFGPASVEAERLASSAAVGAVQARGSIRLRRTDVFGGGPAGEIERIRKAYVVPTNHDFEWADAIVVATSDSGAMDWRAFLAISAEGVLRAGAVISPGDEHAAGPTAVLLDRAIPVIGSHRALDSGSPNNEALITGRRIVLVTRLLKAGPSTVEDARSLLPPGHELQ
jgi:hypothetical protein